MNDTEDRPRRGTTKPGYTLGRTDPGGMTGRQRQIRDAVLTGRSVQDIADDLGLFKQQVSRTLTQLVNRGELRYVPARYRAVPTEEPPELTDREAELLGLVLAGRTPKEIAGKLGLERNTVSWMIGQRLVRQKGVLRFEEARYVLPDPETADPEPGDDPAAPVN